MLKPIVIDFETEAIEARPRYPPKPVGFSIKTPADRRSRYYSWGHPVENNCDFEMAQDVLREAWNGSEPLLFHNAKFDVDVAQEHMGCGDIHWNRVHDTMFLLALFDPHASTFSLKPSSDRLLKMPPTEQEAVRDWLMEHQDELKCSGLLPLDAKIGLKNWGAWISLAPGGLVGKYADGDTKRTIKLFNFLYPKVNAAGMVPAYDRERQLLPILLENERQGIRADLPRMIADEKVYSKALLEADLWIAKKLKTKGLNLDNDQEVADALERCGVVTEFVMTKTGKRSVSKDNLTPAMFKDQKVAQMFLYRNKLNTCLGTFMRSWIGLASADKHGFIHTNWNQVRQSRGNGNAGTRTGRPSTNNPNFLNVPKTFEDKNDGFNAAFVKKLLPSLPELPLMRRYILPDKGQLFGHRDYNQQELRIVAHFEDGELMDAYRDDPNLDMHNFVRDAIERITGVKLERRTVKMLNFGMLYGMGLGALANDLGCPVDEAKSIKAAQRAAMPNLMAMERQIRKLGDDGDFITTWGGRRYYAEPPQVIDGKSRTFSYKLLNYLVQGSAADCTKQALINYHERKKDGRFLVTVYDEINISAPKKAMAAEMGILRDAMADVAFDVPMVSDGKTGPNWADLTKLKEK